MPKQHSLALVNCARLLISSPFGRILLSGRSLSDVRPNDSTAPHLTSHRMSLRLFFIHIVTPNPIGISYPEKKHNVGQEGVGWQPKNETGPLEKETSLLDNATSVLSMASGHCALLR